MRAAMAAVLEYLDKVDPRAAGEARERYACLAPWNAEPAAYGRAAFDRSLRERIVFSDHSLATDSVFAEVHFVSCRNVLIYFNRALRDIALGLFRDALVYRGFLGLGARETGRGSTQADAFDEVSRDHRIYRKRADIDTDAVRPAPRGPR